MSVGMHAVNRSGTKLGQNALVLGAGCIGLMTIASLRAMGVGPIMVSDLFDLRLENASRMGADALIHAKDCNVYEEVMRLTNGQGADVVFETAGSKVTAAQTIEMVRRGGKIVMVGNIYGETPFRFIDANNKEVDILSVFRYVNIYPMAMRAVSSKTIQVRQMISRTFSFEQVQEAFDCVIHEKDSVMKVLIAFE